MSSPNRRRPRLAATTFNDRWTVRVSADATDVVALLRRAATYLESLGPVFVDSVVLDREGGDLILTASFDHQELPADLEYLDPRYAADFDADDEPRDDFDFMVALADEVRNLIRKAGLSQETVAGMTKEQAVDAWNQHLTGGGS